ncbi:hypothetical protein D3C76_1566110 [compost metagenome]
MATFLMWSVVDLNRVWVVPAAGLLQLLIFWSSKGLMKDWILYPMTYLVTWYVVDLQCRSVRIKHRKFISYAPGK